MVKSCSRFDELDPAVKDLGRPGGEAAGHLGGGEPLHRAAAGHRQRVWADAATRLAQHRKSLAEVHMARPRKLEHNRALADRDLAVLPRGTEEMAPTGATSTGRQRYAMTQPLALMLRPRPCR
jgi:tRNA-splicing ligase RtcB